MPGGQGIFPPMFQIWPGERVELSTGNQSRLLFATGHKHTGLEEAKVKHPLGDIFTQVRDESLPVVMFGNPEK